uniref:Thiamine biosynthesis protein S n=1 Tax=Eunotogramma sp. TaxID=2219035 RepID=A0A2U9NQ13_9STRA|nr:hypothetical protein ycf40 [Eunotogramma sp.]
MKEAQKFYLNGEEYYTFDSCSLLDLIYYFNYNKSLLVLEHNNFLCSKENWKDIFIKNNDRIEIVTIVGGG